MANGNGLRKILKELQWAAGGPSRSDYEIYLREHKILGEEETLAERVDLAASVYRDWQRRPQVACVFARRIATQPVKFNIQTVVVPEDPTKEMTHAIESTASAVRAARGSREAITILFPKLTTSAALVAFCKRLGARNGDWRIEATPNPSDRLDRVHVSLRYTLRKNIEAEILGLGPFAFLPATRRAPITVLEIRTRVEGHKKRGRSKVSRSHLADIPWQGASPKWFERTWHQSEDARRAVLGGDDSAARARITFAIPRSLWDGHDK